MPIACFVVIYDFRGSSGEARGNTKWVRGSGKLIKGSGAWLICYQQDSVRHLKSLCLGGRP